jgi:hypothetical protein
MKTPIITIASIIALAVLFVLLPLLVYTFQRYRKKRVLRCPETDQLAEIDINARSAAFSSLFGRPLLKVKNCTLWLKRKHCGEDCLKQ